MTDYQRERQSYVMRTEGDEGGQYLRVTPHIHLSILVSFTYLRASCLLVVSQVSAPCNRAGLTTVKFCKPFHSVSLAFSCHTKLHGISSSFSMLHSLCVIYVAMPPVSSNIEPIYLKCCTVCSSFPRILTGSLPWPLSCPKLKFLVC